MVIWVDFNCAACRRRGRHQVHFIEHLLHLKHELRSDFVRLYVVTFKSGFQFFGFVRKNFSRLFFDQFSTFLKNRARNFRNPASK